MDRINHASEQPVPQKKSKKAKQHELKKPAGKTDFSSRAEVKSATAVETLKSPVMNATELATMDIHLNCSTNLERLNKGPENWRSMLDSGVDFVDLDFPAAQSSLLWEGHLRRPENAPALT